MLEKRPNYLAFGTPDYTEEEIEAVARVMRSGWVGMGQETIAFERELSDYIGAPEVVTVNSCTSALFLALLVENVSTGDEVITPSLTWCATANAALYLGATPVFCEIDAGSFCVTANSILEKVTPRTKAVIVVHYGGYAIDVGKIRDILPAHVSIIEDAAHAMGARHVNGKRVGASGNSVCFSFYANKNLSTADGGAIALFDSVKAERLRSLRMSGLASHAWSRYVRPSSAFDFALNDLGYKMNFTDLQSAIGRVQLRRLDGMAVIRKTLADRYRRRLDEYGLALLFQTGAFDERHARHLLVASCGEESTGLSRDNLLLALREQNIGASIHYRPLHTQPLYQRYGPWKLPITDYVAERIMTLPISARMMIEDVDYVCAHLADIISLQRTAT
ncbi:MAG: DegT/DnrJ/EryC1/StrS family aminotransferase [Nitrospira sp. WS110]|nr:DegT/DnrJ/EryC1/StrS family aminotransferase [Nitrospira sp. WS110]